MLLTPQLQAKLMLSSDLIMIEIDRKLGTTAASLAIDHTGSAFERLIIVRKTHEHGGDEF